ncbi:phosphotransferase family protein [Hypoxylon sp. NC0597]|nr:phosphotransferase family protein [Hypoxylon sp. NC0597]
MRRFLPASAAPCVSVYHLLSHRNDAKKLPAPLPTTAAIEAAMKTLPSIHTPLRRAQYLFDNEGHALLYLEKYQSIPLYLIMGLKSGRQLRELWLDLSDNEILDVSEHSRKVWDQIRSIPSSGIFELDSRITGPFCEEDLNVALALRPQKNWEGNSQRGWIVFTHADIQRKNIPVLEVPESHSGPRKLEVSAVVDWEDAGRYPSYWEYASCFRIVDPYISEATMLRLVRQDLDY